jgi:hypothetical protein
VCDIVRFKHGTIIVNFQRNHHRLFDEVGCVYDGVRMQLPEILYFVYTIKFLFNTEASAQIRIPSALINPVPQLFTTDATGILKQFILLLLLLSLIILIVLTLVF